MTIRVAGMLALVLASFGGAAWGEEPQGVEPRSVEPVEITLASHPESPWALEVSVEGSAIDARHAGYPGLVLEIDCDDEADDGRLPGVAPVFGERRLEGAFWGSRAPFFYPILVPEEHVLERVRVEAGRERLKLRFEGGSYSLLQPAAGEAPLFTELVFIAEEGELTVHMDGLYYLLPSQRGTAMRIWTAAGEVIRRIDRSESSRATVVRDATAELARLEPSGDRHREYFEAVSRVELESTELGAMALDLWIERLQIQVDRNDSADSDLFELDFDHTFKDRGQRSVMARLTMKIPPIEAAALRGGRATPSPKDPPK